MTISAEVWVVDDDRSIRWVLERALQQAGLTAVVFGQATELLQQLATRRPAVVVSDIRMPGMDGLSLLEQIHERYPQLPVIIMTAHSDLDSAVSSYQSGAFEYLPKPFDIDEALVLIQRAVEHSHASFTEPASATALDTSEIIGEAPAMQEVFRAIGRLSHADISVLINGESGTGKELVAKALHRHSPRAGKPFIPLNMAAIPQDLIESELFGHEKGAFTGASSSHRGRFEQADGGTLFLDEIGDMPAQTQTRLLRVLANGEFYRVGGHTPVKVDVRIIAATHQNLEQRVAQGDFREDLFHRLNVIRIQLPRLAQRRQDIPRLARHFLKQCADELKMPVKVLSRAAEQYLCQQPWPGNVRQLENTCRWLTVMASGQEVQVADMPPVGPDEAPAEHEGGGDWHLALRCWAEQQLGQGGDDIAAPAQALLEQVLIEAALAHSHGKKQEAARLLGWGRNTLTRKIKELQLDIAP